MNSSASNRPAPEIQLRVSPQALRGSILAFDFSKRLHHDFVVQGPDLNRGSGGHCRRMRIDPNQGICLDQRGNAVGTLEGKRTDPIFFALGVELAAHQMQTADPRRNRVTETCFDPILFRQTAQQKSKSRTAARGRRRPARAS